MQKSISQPLFITVSQYLTPVRRVWRPAFIVLAICCLNHISQAATCGEFYGIKKSAQDLPYRKFKAELPGTPRIVLSRFSGLTSFSTRYSGLYLRDGKQFSFDGGPMHSVRVGFGENETFLNTLQEFPLGKMKETGYLTAEEVKMFSRLGTSLEPEQINFFQVTREATKEQLDKYPPEILNTRWDAMNTYPKAQNGLVSVHTATFWSVAGQSLDRTQANVRNIQLPWEKEDARKGQALDRKKYKFVWEWGRAAQDIADEISPLYSGNAALNYIDLVMGGGKLVDGHVMFHSFDRVNTRYYLQEHPNSKYPENAKDANDMLFIVPLADMIKRYPPSHFSKHLETLKTLSESKIGEVEALDILIDLRLIRWDELNSTGKVRQEGPIILNDVSVGRLLGMKIMLSKFGMTEKNIEQIMDYLVGISPALHTSNSQNKYQHAADSNMTSYQYQKFNAIEISNLDPALARRDPNYTMAMVFNSYMFYVNRFSKLIEQTYGVPPLQAKQFAIQLLVDHDVSFGLTTSAPEIQQQSEKLNPAKESTQLGTVMERVDPEIQETRPYIVRDSKIYVFPISQIMSWVHQHSSLFLNGDYEINPGFWRQQYFRSQVDIL